MIRVQRATKPGSDKLCGYVIDIDDGSAYWQRLDPDTPSHPPLETHERIILAFCAAMHPPTTSGSEK